MTRSGEKVKSLVESRGWRLRTDFRRSGERRFSGYVVDCDDLTRKFTVEILIDGFPVEVIRADATVDILLREKVGDGCYGFSCSLRNSVVNDSAVVEARLANIGIAIGIPISLVRPVDNASPQTDSVALRWLGGLRFSGWLAGKPDLATAIVVVDGTPVSRVHASVWSHVNIPAEGPRAVRTFDFHLPDKFADGSVHRLTVTGEAGEHLGGHAIAFLAYRDGLRDAVAGQGVSEPDILRAQLFDRLVPISVPFSDYQIWRERIPLSPAPPAPLRVAVIMVGAGSTEDTLESLQQQTHDEWSAASLPHSSGISGFAADDALAFLLNDEANCNLVVFTLAGTLFSPFALQRIASAFDKDNRAQAIYCDLDLADENGRLWPLAFPAFDYERMLEQGYCAHLFALRRRLAERLLKDGPSTLYRLFNSILDDRAQLHSNIAHLPEVLGTLPEFNRAEASAELAAAGDVHLQRRGTVAQTASGVGSILPAARVIRAIERARTTVVIPTRDRQQMLEACIESIQPAIKRTNAAILIVDNDSSDPGTVRYLARLKRHGVTVLNIPGEFNFSRLNNSAARAARSEFLCLLNNDVKAIDGGWLEEMLSRIVEPDVGAVGALLVWPSGVVQHGGIVLGPDFMVAHAFLDRIDSDNGYGDLLRVAHESSAVTAACMLTRRDEFLAVGGMDEVRFPVNFNDVDLCLKLRRLGKRIVFTPHAKLVHLGSTSRGPDIRAPHKERFERELQNLRTKWGAMLAADPYYNPTLSLDSIPFSALAWPIRATELRTNRPPAAVEPPAGF